MSKKYTTKFCDQWLDLTAHKTWTWLYKVASDSSKAGCRLCQTTFDVGNMGISSIGSHEKGKKHMLRANPGSSILHFKSSAGECTSQLTVSDRECVVPVAIISAQEVSSGAANLQADVSDSNPSVSTSSGQASVKRFLISDDVTRAEILWALNGTMSHNSLRSSSSAVELFKVMFHDSDIASRVAMGKDKFSYTVTFGLGPYFQQKLLDVVRSCQFYAISFDESLNKVAQKGQMDIVIRFWDNSSQEVSTRYVTSTFLGHATSGDILTAFTSAISDQNLDIRKMIHVSSDGPNVNLKFTRELKATLAATDPDAPELFEIGTCALHIVHGAYKSAHNACAWQVHSFLRSLYYLFKDFPSRRADYEAITKSSVFPLRFCAIRWVENCKVLQRATEMLPCLKKYIDGISKKPPSSDCFNRVCKVIKEDNMLAAKMGFLQTVGSELEGFLTVYQTNKPLLPFLYNDLYHLLRNLMSRFIKPEVMSSVTDAPKLVAVDVTDKKKLKNIQNIDIGFAASHACKAASGVDVLRFKDECKQFLQHLCTKLMAKCPLKYSFVKGVTCLDPQVMLNESLRESRINTALEKFVEAKRMSAPSADIVKKQYLALCEREDVRRRLKTFTRSTDRLDHTFRELFTENSDDELKRFIQQVLVMFHGNAAVERSFSFNKEFLVENLHEDSLISQRLVHDAVLACGGVVQVPITKPMILAVRSSGTRRNESLKRKADDELKKATQLKRIHSEIKELEIKKVKVAQLAREEAHAIDAEMKKLKDHLNQ